MMGNEKDGGPFLSPDTSEARYHAIDDHDRYIRETRDSKLSPDELRRKAFLLRRDGTR